MTAVMSARVPVISFTDGVSNLKCDVTVGSTDAVLKSTVLGAILQVDQKFIDLVMLVKNWAKCNDINDAREGTFNSFALLLLVITYLQHRKLLPPLKKIVPEAQSILLDTDSKQNILEAVPILVKKVERWAKKHKAAAKSSVQGEIGLAEIFLDFLVTFGLSITKSGLGLAFGDQAVVASAWHGRFECSDYIIRSAELFYTVEDPFDPRENCARTVQRYAEGARKVSSTIEKTLLLIDRSIQTGLWRELDSTLFGVQEEKESLDVMAHPSAQCTLGHIYKHIKGLILEELAGTASVERSVGVDLVWCPPMLLEMTYDIFRAENKKFFTGTRNNFVLCGHVDVLCGIAELEVSKMEQNASKLFSPLGELQKSIAKSQGFPVEVQVAHHSASVKDSIIVLAKENGFICTYLENGRLELQGYNSSSNSGKLERTEDGHLLSRVMLTETFIHILSTLITLPHQKWIKFDFTGYLVPTAWMQKILYAIERRYLHLGCIKAEAGKFSVKLFDADDPSQGIHMPSKENRPGNVAVSAVTNNLFQNSLCVMSLKGLGRNKGILRLWDKTTFRPRTGPRRTFQQEFRQSIVSASPYTIARLKTQLWQRGIRSFRSYCI